jgi:hypothetical protein
MMIAFATTSIVMQSSKLLASDGHAKTLVRNASSCRPEQMLGLHEAMSPDRGGEVC